MKAVTIKLPHQTDQGTMIVEHFMLALAAKPKKIAVEIYAQTLCGWTGKIKESEFKVHYGPETPTVNCGACMDAFLSIEASGAPSDPEAPTAAPDEKTTAVFKRKGQ